MSDIRELATRLLEEFKNLPETNWASIPKKRGIVYLIENAECGLYYIGKHNIPADQDPWVASDGYYGSGRNLRRARLLHPTGWLPRQTVWVGKASNRTPGRDAYKVETQLIRAAKGDKHCLNHCFDYSFFSTPFTP